MKIALAQFNPTVGDFEGNRARILELARDAKSGGADMAVFSELCLCGYPPQDLIERPAFAERNQTELARLARDISLPSFVGFVGKAQDDTGKPVANSAALIGRGKILFEQRKMLLPTYDVFDETRYFQPAHTQHVFPFDPKCWASPFARISGTTKVSGRSGSMIAIPSPNLWGREARSS